MQLARLNPKAYVAQFLRLDAGTQAGWVQGLTADEHQLHLSLLGGGGVLGVVLTVAGDSVELSVAVGGVALGVERALDAAVALQAEGFARARPADGNAVTGLLCAEVEGLRHEALARLGWRVEALEVWPASCEAPAQWRVRGALPCGGRFWSAAAPLASEAGLREVAAALGVPVEVGAP